MKVTLPYPISANRYWRTNGRMYVSTEAQAYKVACGWEAKAAGLQPLKGNVAVTIHVYRPQKSGDLDNRLKVLFDALRGIAWLDDKQIVEIHAYRHEKDAGGGRVVLQIEECFT